MIKNVVEVDYIDLRNDGSFIIRTQNTTYLLEICNGIHFLSGHPQHCKERTKVLIRGSTWGGSMLKINYVGLYMHMEFILDKKTITTSMIESIECV